MCKACSIKNKFKKRCYAEIFRIAAFFVASTIFYSNTSVYLKYKSEREISTE